MNQDYVSAEHDRMLAALVMPCEVVAVDLAAARVRVRSGDWTSAWVRWHSLAAGAARHWRVPSLGEQGVLLSPSGMAAMGTFVPGLFGAASSPPNNRGEVESWHFPDGAVLSYDWQAHRYDLQLPAGTVTVKVGGTQVMIDPDAVSVTAASIQLTGPVSIKGDLAVSGNISSTGSIMDAAGNSNHHTH